MDVRYRIQSIPGRETVRARILAQLPAAEVIIDDGPFPANPWRGYQLCLSNLPDCSHLVVIQDDAICCRNLAQAVEEIVSHYPENPICLFIPGVCQTAGQVRRQLAHGKKSSLIPLVFRDFMPVVAVVWPRECAVSLIDWAQEARLPGMPRPVRSDDAVCGLWARETRTKVLVTIPSLVEHPDDVESTIGKRHMSGQDRGRVACHWIGMEDDPLDIDWS